MKKWLVLLMGMVVLTLVQPVRAASLPSWSINQGLRFHYTGVQDGTPIQLTRIDQSRGQDETGQKSYYQFVTLLDGGATIGRWVAEHRMYAGHNQKTIIEDRFLLQNTHEELVILDRIKKVGEGASFHRVVTFGQESITFRTRTPNPAACRVFLEQRASPLFMSGLRMLWKMAQEGPDTGCTHFKLILSTFFGQQLVSGEMEHSSYRLTPAPVDCNFDAGFGFPCESSESPKSNNPMVYTKTLSQPPSVSDIKAGCVPAK